MATDRKPTNGTRKTGGSAGSRPQGARPQGAGSKGARPQGTGRPAGGARQGARPQGSRVKSSSQGPRPQGSRTQNGGRSASGTAGRGSAAARPAAEYEYSSGGRQQDYYASPAGNKGKKKKKTGKRIALFVAEFLILVIMIGVLYVVTKVNKVEKINVDPDKLVINEEIQGKETLKGYKNIALFGVDSRDGELGKGTRTDTIMVASLDEETGDIKLMSIFRDTYLNLSNDSYNKANLAYAQGGPEQAINMLNMNLDLNITDYVTVDFRALVDVIDSLGGIPIDVQEDEIIHLNNYQVETSEVAGKKIEKVTSPGLQTLNGVQATSYARIRYTAGDDFKRAERQRTVLMEIAKKAKSSDIATLNKIIDQVMPKVATSFSNTELIKYAANVLSYNIVDTAGFPFERGTGKIGKKGSCVVAKDMAANVSQTHQFLFGDEKYEPSAAVREISDKIQSDASQYNVK